MEGVEQGGREHAMLWLRQWAAFRGGARGGLGGYSPRWSMLARRRKMKSDFLGDFWHL